ncbi:hypothetical protein ACSBL2_19675 [Pedobacter sp. AW31-3R]|uniref:hypothetical protein n=1 Tax=Pedobacter sp. AW31-3R TaxID=3445781 RepID=UPI003FA0A443
MYKKTKQYSVPCILFSIAFAVTILLSCEEKKPDPRIKKETRELFKAYIAKELQKDSILLSAKPVNMQSELCIDQIILDHQEINETTNQILEKINADTTEWTNEIIPNAILLSEQDLISFQNSVETNQIKDGNFTLSHPVFFNDLKLAIVKVNFFCGKRCGQSVTLVFEKKDNAWSVLKRYCIAVS